MSAEALDRIATSWAVAAWAVALALLIAWRRNR